MKRFTLTLLSCMLILFLSSSLLAQVEVKTPMTGSKEYFGAAKNIEPLGIGFKLGVNYAAGDYLKFYFTTATYTFQEFGANYYLVARSSDGNYYSDADNDGTEEWSFFSGGADDFEVIFYLTDGDSPFVANGTKWFLCTVADSGAGANSNTAMKVEVPAEPGAGTTGTAYKIATVSTRGTTDFDLGAAVTFFTANNEYSLSITEAEDTVDVEQARKYFVAGGTGTTSTSDAVFTVTDSGSYDYDTNAGVGAESLPYWKFTVDDDMQGIKEIAIIESGLTVATNHPTGNSTVIEVDGDDLLIGANTMSVEVLGNVGLNERTLQLQLEFQGTEGTKSYADKMVKAATDAWIWDTNGTIFRSVWFTTARDSGNYTSFRIANHSSADADVYAEIWMDDGINQTTQPEFIGTITSNGIFSITGYDMLTAAGLTPQYVVSGSGWKGRVRLTVWAPRKQVFGVGLNIVMTANGVGYTRIPLEKQTPHDKTYWEK